MVDELGLLAERAGPLVNAMKSSVSACDGWCLALTIMGDALFTREMVERGEAPAVTVHLYTAPEGCDLQNETASRAANPSLASGIKSLSYVRDRARDDGRQPDRRYRLPGA